MLRSKARIPRIQHFCALRRASDRARYSFALLTTVWPSSRNPSSSQGALSWSEPVAPTLLATPLVPSTLLHRVSSRLRPVGAAWYASTHYQSRRCSTARCIANLLHFLLLDCGRKAAAGWKPAHFAFPALFSSALPVAPRAEGALLQVLRTVSWSRQCARRSACELHCLRHEPCARLSLSLVARRVVPDR